MSEFYKVLVANRGAVASRVFRALRRLNVRSVAIYSDADKDLQYVREAEEAIHVGPSAPKDSYLNIDAILAAASACDAEAIHPGYGFLAENADFARRCLAAGFSFIGPSPHWIDEMGNKANARRLAKEWGLPIGAGTDIVDPANPALPAEAEAIGFPLMVKAAAGGGGIGMMRVDSPVQLAQALQQAQSVAQRGFGNSDVYIEKLIEKSRHVEIQLLGDQYGHVAHLFDRDCSVQRRNQKVIEEAPAPNIAPQTRAEVLSRTTRALERTGYDNIGTLEMLLSGEGEFSFLEMNTRLQVEHGVTEAITGVDLVASQIRAAWGATLDTILPLQLKNEGHAIEARVCAEDPKRFFPSVGKLEVFSPPSGEGVRVETGYAQGNTVTPYYDSLLAKVIVVAPERQTAIRKLSEALNAFEIRGVKTNIDAIQLVLASDDFLAGNVHTGLMQECLDRAR